MNKCFNTVIIGAGNIGAFYDTPESENILSHAHGFVKHSGFNLIGFIDPDTEKAERAADIWGCKVFNSIDEVMQTEKVDIACVSAPDEYHHTILKQLSGYNLKFIFAEKPLTKTMNEAHEIADLYKSNKTTIGVNYSRRYVKEFGLLREDILKMKFGEYLSGTGYYGKGVLHNGSHIIDLLRFLIDEIVFTETLTGCNDYYHDDPSISAIIIFQNSKSFFLQHVDCNYYSIFEIELLFSKGKIRIINSGFNIEVFEIRDNPVYKGYRNLYKTNEIETSLGNAVYSAIDNIYNNLLGNAELKCTLNDGLKAVEICNNLINEF